MRLVDSAFVQAMREGWVVMIDEVNTIRDVALLSINSCLDGTALPVSAGDRRDGDRAGRVRVPARLQPRPRRRHRHSGRVALTVPGDARGHQQLARARTSSARPRRLVTEAMALDRQRIAGEDGLTWTPQFRDIEALTRMINRVGERAALALFISNLSEQVQAGKVQDAEAAAACRMLDQAGYAHLKVSATRRLPSLHGYPRAVTS